MLAHTVSPEEVELLAKNVTPVDESPYRSTATGLDNSSKEAFRGAIRKRTVEGELKKNLPNKPIKNRRSVGHRVSQSILPNFLDSLYINSNQ